MIDNEINDETIFDSIEKMIYRNILQSVKNGNNKAKTKLAWYKLSGYGGVEVDIDNGFKLLEERVKDKDSEAMWMLGLCYEYGMGCEQDLSLAESLYDQSSKNKNCE